MSAYTRAELIWLCEAALRPQGEWHDRDSASAQRQVGEAWVLLRAGCGFEVRTEGTCATDDRTVWVEIVSKGFRFFDIGEPKDKDTFYIPTRQRLAEAGEGDWY